MTKVVKRYTLSQIETAFSNLGSLSDVECVFFVDAMFQAWDELSLSFGVSKRELVILARLLNAFQFERVITQTMFWTLYGSGGNWKKELNGPFAAFFFYTPNIGYRLTPEGINGLSLWGAILRRVFQDRNEFFKAKYGRFTPEQRLKRKMAKPFYRDLTQPEQIAILRHYYSLPYHTKEEKTVRNKYRHELFAKYGLNPMDILNALQAFGPAVKSVRLLPDIAPLFNRPKS